MMARAECLPTLLPRGSARAEAMIRVCDPRLVQQKAKITRLAD
jgi:hypothetical protein